MGKKKYLNIEEINPEQDKYKGIHITADEYIWLVKNRSLKNNKKTLERIPQVIEHLIDITETIKRMLAKEDASVLEMKPKEIARYLHQIEMIEKEKEELS